MKNITKILATLFAAVTLLSFAGCNKNSESDYSNFPSYDDSDANYFTEPMNMTPDYTDVEEDEFEGYSAEDLYLSTKEKEKIVNPYDSTWPEDHQLIYTTSLEGKSFAILKAPDGLLYGKSMEEGDDTTYPVVFYSSQTSAQYTTVDEINFGKDDMINSNNLYYIEIGDNRFHGRWSGFHLDDSEIHTGITLLKDHEAIDKVFSHKMMLTYTKKGDSNNIYYQIFDPEDTMAGHKEFSSALPDGYTTDRIKEVYGNRETAIIFDDGTIYNSYRDDDSTRYNFILNESATRLYQENHIKEIHINESIPFDLVIEADDHNFYEMRAYTTNY